MLFSESPNNLTEYQPLPLYFSMQRLLPFLTLILLLFSCQPSRPDKQSASAAVETESPEQKEKRILSWEKAIRQLEARDSLEQDPDHAILFIGSSSVRLWKNIEEDMAPYPTIRRGYGGARFSDFAHYTERLVYPHQPRAICVFVANDIAGTSIDVSPKEAFGYWNEVYQTIRRQYSDLPVFYIGITPTSSRWAFWDEIQVFNNLVHQQAKKDGNLYYIHTFPAFMNAATQQPDSSLFTSDQLHLNAAGYDRWAAVIKESLDKNLPPL